MGSLSSDFSIFWLKYPEIARLAKHQHLVKSSYFNQFWYTELEVGDPSYVGPFSLWAYRLHFVTPVRVSYEGSTRFEVDGMVFVVALDQTVAQTWRPVRK